MSYTIWPREMARVGQQTAGERDRLRDALLRIEPEVTRAGDGAAPAVTAELVAFRAAQATVTTEVLARIDSALDNAELAVAAYVHGDIEMAAEYGRASIAFTAPRPAPPPPGAPLPETVSGG